MNASRVTFVIALLMCTMETIHAQVVVVDTSFTYEAVDSTFALTITIPQVTGMANLERQKRMNEYIWMKVMLNDSDIQNMLEENTWWSEDDLDSLHNQGIFPHSEYAIAGEIKLLKDNFLCLSVSDWSYYFGAAHGSGNSILTNVNLKTFDEISLEELFNEMLIPIADEDGLVTFGITDQCDECTGCYCITFYLESMASGFGYAEDQLCLEKLKKGIRKKYRRIFRCKK